MKIHNNLFVCFAAAMMALQVPAALAADAPASNASDPQDQDMEQDVDAPEQDLSDQDKASEAAAAADIDKQEDPKREFVPPKKGFAGSYLSGLFARSSGNIQDAIVYLRKAHHDDPTNADVMAQLQGLLLLDGKVDEAVDLAHGIHDSDKKDTVSDLLLCLSEIKEGDMKHAARILDGGFPNGGGQLWQPLISAWLDVGEGKLTKPLKLETLSANVGRAATLVYYHLALINNQAGFKDEAANDFKNAIEDPHSPPSHIMEALLTFYKQNKQPAVLTPLVQAYREANPDSTLVDNARLPASVQEGVAEVLFTMGSVMLEAEVGQDATIYLRLAIYLRPDFAVAALTLGDGYSDLRQYDRADEAYRSIDPADRLHTPALLRIAMNYDRMGKSAEAIATLDTMAKETPAAYEALLTKGDLLRIHGRFQEAVDAYTQAMARLPEIKASHWPLLFARGASYEQMGKWDLAEKDMEAALKLKPDQPEVLNFLGYSWLTRSEHLEEAHLMLKKAVELRPNDAQIIDSMGWALFLTGKYDEAADYMEKAVELLPADPTLNDHLGDIYWRQGRKTEARYQWERSLSFSPEAAEAKSLARKLKEGLPPDAPKAARDSAAPAPLVASRQQPLPTP